MQYAPPPPVDYDANVAFWKEQKRNYKPGPLPATLHIPDNVTPSRQTISTNDNPAKDVKK
jgi:hypothetical protein